MASEHGFGDDGTKATRFCQSDHGNDQMNEQDEQVAHPGNSINTSKSRRIQANLAIRHKHLLHAGGEQEEIEGRFRLDDL